MKHIKEGYMPFRGHKTYFRIVGKESSRTPLILLHGGPGSGHDYFEVLDEMAENGRQLIMYDQTGCGKSYVSGPEDLFAAGTWIEELEALLTHLHIEEYHLLGQSWGGMLALLYVLEKQPAGLRSLILSSTLSSASLWSRELHRLLCALPKEEQVAIRYAEITGNYEDPGYLDANRHFMRLHCSDFTSAAPECLTRPKKTGIEAYRTAWGPNEYTPTGNLKDYEITGRLSEVKTPSLIISGTEDLCTPVIAKTMYDALPHARWELFAGAKHMCFADQPFRYMRLAEEWMTEHDRKEEETK